jgi:hypothetical protein
MRIPGRSAVTLDLFRAAVSRLAGPPTSSFGRFVVRGSVAQGGPRAPARHSWCHCSDEHARLTARSAESASSRARRSPIRHCRWRDELVRRHRTLPRRRPVLRSTSNTIRFMSADSSTDWPPRPPESAAALADAWALAEAELPEGWAIYHLRGEWGDVDPASSWIASAGGGPARDYAYAEGFGPTPDLALLALARSLRELPR